MRSNRQPLARRAAQRGTTLIVGLIMLVLITLVVLNAFNMSSSNLKAVGNMQLRDEAVAATNQAIEQVISSPFALAPQGESFNVDINKDGVNDFEVVVATPSCLRARVASTADPSDVELGTAMSGTSTWNTDWDVSATATDISAGSGASVTIRQGVRVLLTEAQKNASCP